MSNTRQHLSELFTPIYDEFMLVGFAEDKMVAPQVVEVIDDPTKDYKTDGLSGLGTWERADELSSGGYEDLVLGYPNTITALKYWKKLQLPFEANDQMEYAKLKAQVGQAKMIGIGGNDAIERLVSAVIYGAFGTTYSPDGQFLASNSHPKNREETSTTYDNLLDGPLSHDNLELAEKQIADNHFDMKGIPFTAGNNPVLLHAPALKGTVKRLLSDRAEYRPGDLGTRSEMEINQFAGAYNPIVWKYISAKLGGTDTQWHIIFKELGFLKLVYAARPSFDSWIDKDIEAYIFKGRLMAAADAVDWRSIFSSTGL